MSLSISAAEYSVYVLIVSSAQLDYARFLLWPRIRFQKVLYGFFYCGIGFARVSSNLIVDANMKPLGLCPREFESHRRRHYEAPTLREGLNWRGSITPLPGAVFFRTM